MAMDLNELLSYKPSKKVGEKRPLEEGQDEHAPSSKAPRQKLSGDKLSRRQEMSLPNPLAAPVPQDSENGISDEEKLKLLLSMGDEEDDTGE